MLENIACAHIFIPCKEIRAFNSRNSKKKLGGTVQIFRNVFNFFNISHQDS